MKTDFASILSGLRHDGGLSQKKVADDLGISQALLSHYENGVREPKLEFILKACDYYGVTADYMLGRTGDKNGSGSLVLRFNNADDKRFADAAMLLLSMLADIGDEQLRQAAIRYFCYSLYVVLSAMRTNVRPYDPLLDAAIKTAEACFMNNVRRVQGNADLLPLLSDEALQKKYPHLFKAMLEIDDMIGNAVSSIHDLNNSQ
jgi:transcriptional regulator with XRE-family HTH domain